MSDLRSFGAFGPFMASFFLDKKNQEFLRSFTCQRKFFHWALRSGAYYWNAELSFLDRVAQSIFPHGKFSAGPCHYLKLTKNSDWFVNGF